MNVEVNLLSLEWGTTLINISKKLHCNAFRSCLNNPWEIVIGSIWSLPGRSLCVLSMARTQGSIMSARLRILLQFLISFSITSSTAIVVTNYWCPCIGHSKATHAQETWNPRLDWGNGTKVTTQTLGVVEVAIHGYNLLPVNQPIHIIPIKQHLRHRLAWRLAMDLKNVTTSMCFCHPVQYVLKRWKRRLQVF